MIGTGFPPTVGPRRVAMVLECATVVGLGLTAALDANAAEASWLPAEIAQACVGQVPGSAKAARCGSHPGGYDYSRVRKQWELT
jgi:hypothetical protein